MKQRLRPQRSVSLLHGIIRIAMISKNSVIAVCTPLTVVSRSSLMSVIITFMFEPAKLQMNWASASGRINLRGDISARSETTASLGATEFSSPGFTPAKRVREQVLSLVGVTRERGALGSTKTLHSGRILSRRQAPTRSLPSRMALACASVLSPDIARRACRAE